MTVAGSAGGGRRLGRRRAVTEPWPDAPTCRRPRISSAKVGVWDDRPARQTLIFNSSFVGRRSHDVWCEGGGGSWGGVIERRRWHWYGGCNDGMSRDGVGDRSDGGDHKDVVLFRTLRKPPPGSIFAMRVVHVTFVRDLFWNLGPENRFAKMRERAQVLRYRYPQLPTISPCHSDL